MLKDHQYQHKKQIFDIQEVHTDEERNKLESSASSFLNSFMIDTFHFVTALITLIVTLVVIYVICCHAKLKTLVTNIALQHIGGAEAADSRMYIALVRCNGIH